MQTRVGTLVVLCFNLLLPHVGKFVQGLSPQWKVSLLSCPCFKALEEFIIEFTQKIIVDFVMGEFLHCGEKRILVRSVQRVFLEKIVQKLPYYEEKKG